VYFNARKQRRRENFTNETKSLNLHDPLRQCLLQRHCRRLKLGPGNVNGMGTMEGRAWPRGQTRFWERKLSPSHSKLNMP